MNKFNIVNTRYAWQILIKLQICLISNRFPKNIQISSFTNIRPVGAELFRAD